MVPDRLAAAHRLLTEAIDALQAAAGTDATVEDRLSVLMLCEGAGRRLDRVSVATTATLDRDGTFTERGYRNATLALADLLGCDRNDARRRTTAAEHVHPRTGLDGTQLPPKLPATADRFADGRIGLDHVHVIASPSWCEVHHIVPWETGGTTSLNNCVMLCKVHHRLLHHADWLVRVIDGLPEFIPPRWIDPTQRPRRQPEFIDVA